MPVQNLASLDMVCLPILKHSRVDLNILQHEYRVVILHDIQGFEYGAKQAPSNSFGVVL